MIPEIIIHNSISLDGSLTGFMPDMALHYKIAGDYKPDAHLIGSQTIISGNEMFGEDIPEEISSDFEQPDRSKDLPWWVIVDSGGRLKGMLHTCRRFEFCRDVIVLVSKTTTDDYKQHLQQRNYRFFVAGDRKIDLTKAIELLVRELGIKRILTDTGSVLGNLLINMGLVKEISVLVHPVIIGQKCYPMFADINKITDLKLIKSETYDNGCVWNVYRF
jgi:2,5-diamino-6-(ribosylamino)-4(3H)-pyrimidinone 5'-phosphate reductase